MQMLVVEILIGISNMLMIFGMLVEKVKEIGNIVGMVLVVVVFFVILLFLMFLFFKNVGQMISNLVKNGFKLVGNLMKSVVKVLLIDFFNSMGKVGIKVINFSKLLVQIVDKIDDVVYVVDKVVSVGKIVSVIVCKIEMGMNGINMVFGVINVVVSGGLNLQVGVKICDMKEMMVGMMYNNVMMQFIEDLLKLLIVLVVKNYDQFNEMFEGMLIVLN